MDDLWDEEAHGEGLEREWAARRQQFWNSGYREGLEDGKQDTVQAGFNEGYAAGAKSGEAWGRAYGAAVTLAALATRTPVLAQHVAELQQLHQRLAAMPTPQVTVAVCRYLAGDATASAADEQQGGGSNAAAPGPGTDLPPAGHVQHREVEQAKRDVDATLRSLGLPTLAEPAVNGRPP